MVRLAQQMRTNAQACCRNTRKERNKQSLTITTDCNSKYVFADPYKGAMITVAEAARNIIYTGGEPIGITNFTSTLEITYVPEIYIVSLWPKIGKRNGDACRKFITPVTGGNVKVL